MIIVHAQGNSTIGIGNLSRCFELIDFLEKKYNVIGIFECDEKLFEKYKKINIYRSDNIESSLNIISSYPNSLYVCDLFNPNKELSNSLRTFNVKKIFYFNGIENGFEPDIWLVTDGFDYKIEKQKFDIYRGFEYYIVGNDIVKNRPNRFKEKENIKNILVCFGGADPAFYTEAFAKTIQEDDNYFYTIILGPAMKETRKKEIQKSVKNNIKFISNPKDMIKLYKTNDLLITLGGMMTYEAMCLGLPISAVRWKYLEYIVKSFDEKEMANDLGCIENAYNNLLNLELENINKKAQNAFNIINGQALTNIKNIIEKYM